MRGLANSRIGLVLVTPALFNRLPKERVADNELSALLSGNRLIPIEGADSRRSSEALHEALRIVSRCPAS